MLRFLLMLWVCTYALSEANAQFVVGANNGANAATSYPAPIFDYFKTSRSQYLYLASELTAAGMTPGFIDELSWNVTVIPAGTNATENYTIKMLSTAVSSLSITGWESGASLVWGPADYNAVVGTNLFTLDNPFYWNGTDNIIVEVCGGDDNIEYTKNVRTTWTGPLGFNASRTYASDTDTDPCGYTGTEFEDAVTGGADYRPQATFGMIEAVNCADLPIIGPTDASSTEVCAGETFILSIASIAELGIEYAWYSSPNGVSWTLIPGATGPSLSYSQIDTSYYRCTVTCTFSGDNSNSIPAYITMKPETECYCEPSYVLGTQEGDFVSNVSLGDIANPTGAELSPYYIYYEDLSTEITKGQSYTLTISCGEYELNNCMAAWIDFDRDGTFSASEKLGETTAMTAYSSTSYTFVVPAWAVVGQTRMRVRDVYNVAGILPCGGYEYGEAEDYNVQILSGEPPVAAFTFAGDPNVTFTDLSTGEPLSWSWTFGDGGVSTEVNPTHLYTMNGTYSVCLTVASGLGENTNCQDVIISSYLPPAAAFTYTGDPTFLFTDMTANDPETWAWDFGDGFTSTDQNPEHTYIANGTYTVCLSVTNVTGSDNVCENVVVNGYPTPLADFSYTGDPTVDFTDLSTNDPDSWFWEFGDGGLSGDQNPSHTYLANGVYSVCLTVSGPGGLNTACQDVTIAYYGSAPVADFSYVIDELSIDFTDLSTNDPTDWLWDFGDGEISGIQNPSHTYEEAGQFTICLTATNGWGDSEIACKTLEVFVGIQNTQQTHLDIYPNPTSDLVYIPNVPVDAQIRVIDMQGRFVQVNSTQAGTITALHVQSLPAGTYQVLISTQDAMYHALFIKE